MEAESLLLVLELDHLPGFKKKLGHRTQVGVKASRLRVNQLLDRAVRLVGKVLSVNSYDFSFGQ